MSNDRLSGLLKSHLRTRQLFMSILLVPPVMWAVANGVLTRTPGDFVRYSSYIAVPISAIFAAFAVYEWRIGGWARPTLDTALTVALLFVGLAGASAVYYAIGASIKDAYYWLLTPRLIGTNAVAGACLVTTYLGSALFYFRLRLRSIYGLSEALAGVAVVAQRVASDAGASAADPGFYLAILTAGVYLVVRGLDNFHQGLTRDPLDPAVKGLRQWFWDEAPLRPPSEVAK